MPSPLLAALIAVLLPCTAAGQLVFTPPQPLGGLEAPRATALGDVDADGDLDVVASGGGPAVRVLLMEEGVATPGQLLEGAGGGRVELVDLDGDAVLDLALAQTSFSPGGFVVRLGEGDGTFGFEKGTQAGTNPVDFAFTDVDGDRLLDAVVVNAGVPTLVPPDIEVLLGLGDGSFALVREQQLPSGPLALELVDANEDGEADAAIAFDDGSVRVLYGTDGEPGFSGSWSVELHEADAYAGNGADLAGADLDLDGHVDLASTWSDGTVTILAGLGDGTFARGEVVEAGADPSTLALGDFDGNGTPDLVAANVEGQDLTFAWRGGAGAWQTLFVSGLSGPRGPAAGDVDGDGRLDVVAGNAVNDEVVTVPNATYAPEAPFVDVGSNLVGSKGWPILLAQGTLLADDPYAFELYNAWPGCTAILVCGFSALDAPFKGGTYVPSPDVPITLAADEDGRATVSGERWPAGASGATLYLQWWIIDPGAQNGWSATTAVEATVP